MHKKLHLKKKICFGILLLLGLLFISPSAFSQNPRQDALLALANTKVETNYTIPSFTEMKRRAKAAQATNPSETILDALELAINNLKANDMPYNIVMNVHADPKTKMAFNWLTNTGMTGGRVEIVQGEVSNQSAFATPLQSINATCTQVSNLNYNVSANNLVNEAGFSGNNLKKSYTENKALATDLTPNTTYSFRVGKEGAWSEIGTFTTAKATKAPFSFCYTTDPQANTYEMFDISQTTTHAGFSRYPNIDFWLHCGDLVETSGGTNAEWEWEQLLESQQDIFLKMPFAPVQGNHDVSTNLNFRKHFNTEGFGTADNTGSTYSYIYGDVQFFAINSELYSNNTYMTALASWMRNEVAAHPNIKWRFVYYHKTVYTGSGSHQNDSDGRTWRNAMAPLFDELNIDLAFQGHDHIYEVIGPVKNKKLVAGAVTNQLSVPVHSRENVTGKWGGTFNVNEGTLYFLNNSSGKKKYEPRPFSQMTGGQVADVIDYPSLFTGRFGQTGNPTYSNVFVSTDTIIITTYEVLDNGTDLLFDEIKLVKPSHLDSLISDATNRVEANYTVPSFTELKRRLVAAQAANPSAEVIDALEIAINNLKPNTMPYNIGVTVYQDPTTKMGFNWFNNENITGGKVEIVQGKVTGHSAFATPLQTVNATVTHLTELNYNVSANEIHTLCGIPVNTKKNYTENQALATNLTPNTTYSYRVGKEGAWSEIGSFTTAKANKEAFSFVYTTDPQAHNYEYFHTSQLTTHVAHSRYPDATFWLHCGDLIETSANPNSEWEWEQLFETQQDIFQNIIFAPVIGNHDNSAYPTKNYSKHFFTDSPDFDQTLARTPGATYSYVFGDALFLAINSEEYNNSAYTTALCNWARAEVAAHPNVKWRIVHYHKAIYTGSSSHQNDADALAWRNIMTPLFDELNIDIAFQGHDHIYEVIGPVKNRVLVPGSVSDVQSVPVIPRENVTGKTGGTYNVNEGTLYFLNNSAGKKKYEPRPFAQMTGGNTTDIPDYPSLFTGRFGQTGNPTYSNVTVSTDAIIITTYEVLDNGTELVFDEIKVVKPGYTITASAIGNGTIDPAGATTLQPGANQTYTFTPAANHHITSVLIDGVNNPDAVANGYYTFSNVTAIHTIVVTFVIDTYTITASVTGNGFITPNGTLTVDHGSSKTFSMLPAAGHHIEDVLVNGVSNPLAIATGSYTFNNATNNQTINVIYAPNAHIIYSASGAHGSITPEGAVTVYHGENKTFNFTSDAGYHIDKVWIDGVTNLAAALNGSYTFNNISGSHDITVSFAATTFTITATAGANGSITPSGSVQVSHSSDYNFYIIPNAEYEISAVYVDDVSITVPANGIYIFTNVQANHTITALFSKKSYFITTSSGANGTVTPQNPIVVHGNNQTLNFIPELGYKVEKVFVDGLYHEQAVEDGFYTFTNVLSNHIITAQFEKKTYNVFLPTVTGASVFPVNGSTSPVEYGNPFMFAIELEEAYKQSYPIVRANNIIITSVSGIYTLNNIVIDQTVTVTGVEPNVGIIENRESIINIFGYGNVVTIVNEALIPVDYVEITDMFGRVVWKGRAPDMKTEITLQVATGIYVVRIITNDNQHTITKVHIN